mmetsp:Transcript_6230/g.12947  ORF Transcript_6230/g.12947 Transcript_6230/m.12947 type:complete len:313 (+) Transcript_6230:11590-12528(+)
MRDVLVDIHRRPSQRYHTWAELVLHVVEVRAKDHGGDGDDLGDNTVVLGERPMKLVVKALELLLLEESNLRGLGDLDSHPVEALGLADKLQDLVVKVDVELVVLGVADDKGGLEAGLGLIDGLNPGLVPKVLEGYEGARDLVVHLDDALGILARKDVLVGLELLHGLLDALEEVARPSNVSGDGGQVTRNGRLMLLLLVKLLNLLKFHSIVLEDDVELAVQVGLEGLALEDGLELVKQVEGVLNRSDILERHVDKLLESALEIVDLHIKLDVVAVELVVVVVEEVVRLGSELLLDLVKAVDEVLHALKLVLG